MIKQKIASIANVIISVCWLSGSFIGFLPVMGWYQEVEGDFQCLFLKVMDPKYLVFLYFVTILTPALLMAASYIHIYRVVLKQVRQIVTMNPEKGTAKSGRSHGGTMLRVLGPQQKKEVKATQNLSIIVLFFMICWIPLYTINFILSFCADCFQANENIMLFCIILSHANSAGNPLLYAYHLRDFRSALKHFLCQLFRIGNASNSSSGLTGRHSSNQAYQQYHGHSRFTSQRRDVMASLASQSYGGSQLSLNHEPHTMTTPISAIVTQTAALAAAPTGNSREIWRISEVPSISEEYSRDKISLHECSKASNDSESILKRRISETSGVGNSCFKAEYVEGEDDVFFEECRHSHCISKYEGSNESLSDDMKMAPLEKVRNACISSSSPQLERGVFVVEAEVNNDVHPKTFLRSSSAVESKKNSKHSPNGDCLPSPVKIKLSPLKTVGEFLFHSGSKRAKNVNVQNGSESGGAIPDTFLRKENSIGVN
ncbi:uncharacterized protein LOC116175440 [Photinus pyralis]|nr:uncharacterized protein LOC116175440 [Photinus pyralis]